MSELGVVEVAGELVPGTEAWLVQNFGGAWMDHLRFGDRVAEATVGEDGTVRFEGLALGQRYWLVGEGHQQPVRSSSVTAKASVGSPYAGLEAPRGTLPSLPQEDFGDRPESGAVGPRQQDVPLDVVQRSDTPVGAATPIPASERSPYPDQGDAGGVKASDTEAGEHVPATEVARQDEVPEETLQRSDTEAGTAQTVPAEPEFLREGEEPADVPEAEEVELVSAVEEVPLEESAEVGEVPASDTPTEGGSAPAVDASDRTEDTEAVAGTEASAETTVDVDPDAQPAPELAGDEQAPAPAAADAEPDEDASTQDRDDPTASAPWAGYDDASAAELIEAAGRKRSVERLQRAVAYERAHGDRSTVIAAFEARAAELGAE